jgi:hypothetical protein
MLTLKEYTLEGLIDPIRDFIEQDDYADALKSEIAIYRISEADQRYIILVASRRLIPVVEKQPGWKELLKNDTARPAIVKNAFPLVYGSASIKDVMAEVP